MNKQTFGQLITLVGIFSFVIILTSCKATLEEVVEENLPVITEDRACFSLLTQANDEPLRIVGLGDSLTVGVGDEKNEGGYIGKLTNKLSDHDCAVTLTNHSVEGQLTTDLLQNLQEDDVARAIEKAHIIMYTIGANDLVALARKERMQFSEEALEKAEGQYAERIDEVLQTLRSLNENAQIYVIGFYNPISSAIINNEQIDLLVTKWNNMSKHHTAELEQAFFVRIDDLFSKKMNHYLADDHFHPNHLGYEKIAERLRKIIQARSE